MSSITLTLDEVELEADLMVPSEPLGIVAFAHGTGSNRRSPRNQLVAERLRAAGLGTLLLDLLTAEEAQRETATERPGFDVAPLARRLVAAVDWVGGTRQRGLPIGCFGASSGAAAALVAAAARPETIRAVVSRGGRPDLARLVLGEVRAPTLLIVGDGDRQVLALNREAQEAMRAVTRLELIEGATHLFEEPGALERVAELSRDWFLRQFAVATGTASADAASASASAETGSESGR
jgi:putative phosphoribosyl transferase